MADFSPINSNDENLENLYNLCYLIKEKKNKYHNNHFLTRSSFNIMMYHVAKGRLVQFVMSLN